MVDGISNKNILNHLFYQIWMTLVYTFYKMLDFHFCGEDYLTLRKVNNRVIEIIGTKQIISF